MSHKVKRKIFVCIFIFVLVVVAVIFMAQNKEQSGGVKWNGKQNISQNGSQEYIAIPGVTEMYFSKNNIRQNVNIYNPEGNNCIMEFQIIVDNNVIWDGDEVYPGYGYYEIELVNSLSEGTYDAMLVIRCYSIENHQEVNGGTICFDLIVN